MNCHNKNHDNSNNNNNNYYYYYYRRDGLSVKWDDGKKGFLNYYYFRIKVVGHV